MLPKKYRLDKKEIPNIVRRGKALRFEGYTIRAWYDNSISEPEFCIIVPKKVEALATGRNYIKRRISHQIQLALHANEIPKAKYVIVVHEDFYGKGKSFEL